MASVIILQSYNISSETVVFVKIKNSEPNLSVDFLIQKCPCTSQTQC